MINSFLSFVKMIFLAIVCYFAAVFLIFFFMFFLDDFKLPSSNSIDTVRVNDLETIVSYVEEYKAKQGHYPFQDTFISMRDKNNLFKYLSNFSVIIASNEQQQIVESNLYTFEDYADYYSHAEGELFSVFYIHVTDFIDELEKGLGRDIVMPFDPLPHSLSSSIPRIYKYEVSEQGYAVNVPVSKAYSFSSELSSLNRYYKVFVGRGHYNERNFEDLLANRAFTRLKNKNSMKIKKIRKDRDRAYQNQVFKNSNELLYLPTYIVHMSPLEVAVRVDQITEQIKKIPPNDVYHEKTKSRWDQIQDDFSEGIIVFMMPAFVLFVMLLEVSI